MPSPMQRRPIYRVLPPVPSTAQGVETGPTVLRYWYCPVPSPLGSHSIEGASTHDTDWRLCEQHKEGIFKIVVACPHHSLCKYSVQWFVRRSREDIPDSSLRCKHSSARSFFRVPNQAQANVLFPQFCFVLRRHRRSFSLSKTFQADPVILSRDIRAPQTSSRVLSCVVCLLWKANTPAYIVLSCCLLPRWEAQ